MIKSIVVSLFVLFAGVATAQAAQECCSAAAACCDGGPCCDE